MNKRPNKALRPTVTRVTLTAVASLLVGSAPRTAMGHPGRSLKPHGALRLFLIVLAFIVLLLCLAFLLPLGIGVWLPDIINAPRHTIAEHRIASGDTFQVIQYWNRIDFYTTELVHVRPNGPAETHVLDGDDNKSWSVPLAVDEQANTVSVTLSGNRLRKIRYQTTN